MLYPEVQVLQTDTYPIHVGLGAVGVLKGLIQSLNPGKVLVVTDTNTAVHCLPHLISELGQLESVTFEAGEKHKTLHSCERIWEKLTEMGAGRDALVVNLGGGLVGDVGGFAAATYKRGVRFVQVPTTLLAMVDASVGGKTGINFQGYKNHLRSFQDPLAVVIDPVFLDTLPQRELVSGLAEMFKHGLIADGGHWTELKALGKGEQPTLAQIKNSIQIKAAVVAQDPKEAGLRAILNFGHTVAHALERLLGEAGRTPILHGEAVAMGMICEAKLAVDAGLLERIHLAEIVDVVGRHFPIIPLRQTDPNQLLQNMYQDKKNLGGGLRFALIRGIGSAVFGQPITDEQVLDALRFYQSIPQP